MAIGKSIPRLEAWDKVTGKAQYTDDLPVTGLLCARLLTSIQAHAKIRRIDTSKAQGVMGVKSILTGEACPHLFGPLLQDRPALAQGVVRYAGEPIAIVVAVDEATAEYAVRLIEVEYEALPIVLTPSASLAEGAVLIHTHPENYKRVAQDVYPQNDSNIASSYRIRKGDAATAVQCSEVIVRQRFSLPSSDHLAMEVRTARAEISADGKVIITTSSQAPYTVKSQIADIFLLDEGKIQIKVPFLGGGFGGKAPVMLEVLVFLASKSVGGKPVRLTIPREQDMAAPPSRIGLEAEISIGATKEGLLQGAQLTYWVDCGAYTDISPYMTKAIAVDCTGPYHIENLSCDSYCVYTNHTYATSYRSFAHESYTFCMERTLDMLARKCKLDPLELRIKNAIRPGSLTPTQVMCSYDLMGDLPQCLDKLRMLSQWDSGAPVAIKENTVRAKGISCLWKTENPPTNAISGALITFNADGSVNLNTGVVEMGSGGQTHLAQILAERLCIDPTQVHVVMPVDTKVMPEHWKTVASMTEYMAGNAVLRAADDILAQLRSNGAQALSCPVEDVEVAHSRVYSKKNPERFIAFKNIVHGYKEEDDTSIGEPVLGRGGFMLKGLSHLDSQTGAGKSGPAWTVGAQVVEVEANLKTFTYRILNASTVMDVGTVINPEAMRAMVAGGMAMGISMSSREAYRYNQYGVLTTPNLRTYKLLHIGQEPDYRVEFVQTPQTDSPYGVRSYSEHGIIGIPAALANALSAAFGTEITTLPLTPEMLWRLSKEDRQ